MPVRTGSSSECDNGVSNARRPSAQAKRATTGSEDEADSLVLARKPAKRRRKANGLDHKLSRMLHRANASYAAMNAIANQGKRERTTSVGSSSSTSYEVPRTPVDDVHDAVVSQQGRIGQGFKLIKLSGSSEQHEQAFEEVFTDNSLPSWRKSRRTKGSEQNDIDEAVDSNPLPSWLSSTFDKLSSGHPLKRLVEAEDMNSVVGHHTEQTAVSRESRVEEACYIAPKPEEESIFAFQRPETAQQPFATNLARRDEIKEDQSTLLSEPQPFSTPGPTFRTDAYSLDFSNPLIRHSSPNGPPQYSAKRSNPNNSGRPLPFSTPGPAASFTVPPPPSRSRQLRFDVPDFDNAVALECDPVYPPLSRNSTTNLATTHIPNVIHPSAIPQFAEETGQPLEDYEEMADPFADDESPEFYDSQVGAIPMLSQTASPTAIAPFKDILPTKTKSTAGGDGDDEWLFSTEALVIDPAYPESHEDYDALLAALNASEPDTNENIPLPTYGQDDEMPMLHMPTIAATPTRHWHEKSHTPINPAPGVYVSPRVHTSSSSLPAKADIGSDPFVVKTAASEVPGKAELDLAQSHTMDNGPPSATRRPKFRPAIIDEHIGRKILPKATDPEPEYTKTPVREEVEEFIRVFGSDERMSQLTNDTIESWD